MQDNLSVGNAIWKVKKGGKSGLILRKVSVNNWVRSNPNGKIDRQKLKEMMEKAKI